MVIESDREDQGYDEQHHQHARVARSDHQEGEETKDKNYEFGDYDIRQDRAHEEAVLTFE